MNYSKLKLSFILLLIMSIIQGATSFFVLHHLILTLLSAGAVILCISGIIYINKKTQQ